MPSPALGTLAISGQEGYDQPASMADAPAGDHNTTSLHHNTALQPLDTRAANTLSSATTIDVSNLDGARDIEDATVQTGRSTLQIGSATQDSPAHDFHVHTEAANEAHAQLKRDLALKEEELHNMSAVESPGAAESAAAAQAMQEERHDRLVDELEKNTAGGAEQSTHFERTMSADEKRQATATSNASSAPAADVATPLPQTHPSTTTSLESTQATSTPALNITLLLPTGARHAFRITESYLTKRGVSIPGVDDKGNKDVFSISIYQIKELILREWKEEWGGETTVGPPPAGGTEGPLAGEEVEEGRMRGKPSSPAAIRLIFFGRLLGDEDKAEDCRFNKTSANVVHMTVRPQDVVDEEEVERKRNEGRSDRERRSRSEERVETVGCRCVIL